MKGRHHRHRPHPVDDPVREVELLVPALIDGHVTAGPAST